MDFWKKLAGRAKVVPFIWGHPANREKRLRTLARAIYWQLYKRVTGKGWTLSVFDDLQLKCPPDSNSASKLIYSSGRSDFHEMSFINRYLRSGDHVIDIGANIGVYTLLMASKVGSRGVVDAFEASPETMERLRRNIELNELHYVRLHAKAVGEANGSIAFTRGLDTTNHVAESREYPENETVEVPVATLDKFLPTDAQPVLVKSDIEGAELKALKGAKQLLSRQVPPVWLLEVNDLTRRYGHTEVDVERWLNNRGYDLAIFDAEECRLRFIEEAWKSSPNVFAIARDRRRWVCERLVNAEN